MNSHQDEPPKSLARRLSALDSCAVSDALDARGLPGAVVGIRPVWTGPGIAGRVVTVDVGPAGDGMSSVHLGARAIAAANPGDVIVVAHHARCDVAAWGGLLSRAAQARGIQGVVVDGALRDVDEAQAIGFPLFARAAVPVSARGRVVERTVNEGVVVTGIEVRPGDYVVADGSGVVFVSSKDAAHLVSDAERISMRERDLAARLDDGEPVIDVMGTNYESMLDRDGPGLTEEGPR